MNALGFESGALRPDTVMDLLNNRISRRSTHLLNVLPSKEIRLLSNDELFDLNLGLLNSGGLVIIDEAAWSPSRGLDDAGLLIPTRSEKLWRISRSKGGK